MADNVVEIEVKANTKNAEKEIKRLSKEFTNLQEKDGIVLNAEAFNIAKQIQNMKAIPDSLSKAFKEFYDSGKIFNATSIGSSELDNLKNAFNKLSTSSLIGSSTVNKDVSDKTLDSKSVSAFNSVIANLTKSMDKLSKSTRKTTHFFDKFSNRIKSIVSYRIIRGGLSKLTQYLSEGVQNIVKYEKALSGMVDSRATDTINSLATSIQTLKNNLGAMAVSLLSAIQPALQTIISWLNSVIDILNQFFTALGGGSKYRKATNAMYDYGKAVSSTSNKLKTLAFDELNVLNNDGSTNAGGTSFADMFEEADIESGISNFANKLKPVLNWINENMSTILKLAVAIGGAIAGWKISKGIITGVAGITEKLGELVGFASANSILTFTLVLAGVGLFTAGILGAIKDGTDAIDIALADIGLTLSGVALGIMTGVGVLTGGIVGLIVAMVASIGFIIYDSWDDITSGFTTMISKITTKFKEFVNRCIGNLNIMIDAINKVITGFNNLFGTSIKLIGKINEIVENTLSKKENLQALKANRMASGGVPTTGTLFWAGEAGAEVIGSVGGRTTVYNSDQLGNAMATANADVVNAINTLIGVVRSKSGNVTISASDIRKAVNQSSMRVGV